MTDVLKGLAARDRLVSPDSWMSALKQFGIDWLPDVAPTVVIGEGMSRKQVGGPFDEYATAGYVLGRLLFGTAGLTWTYSGNEQDARENARAIARDIGAIALEDLLHALGPTTLGHLGSYVAAHRQNDAVWRKTGADEANAAIIAALCFGLATAVAEDKRFA